MQEKMQRACVLRFHSRLGYQHVGIQNASENARKKKKKKEKRKKYASETMHSEIRPLDRLEQN